jgi:monofunctional biosynthetic peptidoglycan transglycosylase
MKPAGPPRALGPEARSAEGSPVGTAAGRWLWRLALLVAAAVLGLQLWYLAWIAVYRWVNPAETAFMARELARLEKLRSGARLQHVWIDYGAISTHLKRAVVAAEDARFVEHEGVDWEAVTKALESNRKRGRPARGGSTISQQLAKNLFLSPERSYLRKGQELVITTMIEALWDKRRILEVYLNVAEWGEGVFGAEAAARHYYRSSAARLGPEQAAQLAVMLPRPRYFERNRGSQYLAQRSATIQRYMGDAVVP